MTKQVTKTAVPRLRFPEFEGSPHWTISKLGTRGRFLGGGTPSRENAEFWAGIHPWISSSDISDEEIRAVRPSRFITDEAIAQSATQVVPAGSVLIVARVGVGKVAVSEEQLHTSQDFANLVPSADSPTFLAYLLKSRKSALLAFNQGMAIKGFTRDDIAGLEVPIPEKSEQQKIADCLTSLDEVIAAQGRKVEALKAHKRGLMQRLFPREGEARPSLRFPEFRDAPEWREAALGPLTSKVGSGVTPRGGDANYKANGRPFVRSQNVGWGLLLLDDIVFIDEGTHASFVGTEIMESDVLLNITGASIGRSAVADKRITGGNVNQHVCIIRAKRDELNPVLLNQFLISERGQEQIDSFQAGGNRQGLNFAQIRSFQIPLPPTSDEQQRIADCLSSLDTQITAESNQLAALKTHKQGLMQQLFPAPDAATA